MEAAAVKVAVRVRPLSAKEEAEGSQAGLVVCPESANVVLGSGKNEKPFSYDYVFGASSTSSGVYETAVAPLLVKALDGFNVTVFAYGQTGSGKTFTMDSVTSSLTRDLFTALSDGHLVSWRARVSVAEIYNEAVYDLLSREGASTAKNVVIRDNEAGEVVVAGLTDVSVASADEALAAMARGLAARATASTQMNARSSRSHAVYTITVEQTASVAQEASALGESAEAAAPALSTRVSRINLVDLAGSERAKRTGAEGARLKEAASINKGLLALGNVINALAAIEDEAAAAAGGAAASAANERHVPFRDSKLTRLLKSSLGGNAHTLMIACCSPADSYLEETLSTLRYAARARTIKNKASVNEDAMTGELGALRRQVREMQVELLRARAAAAGISLSAEEAAAAPPLLVTAPSASRAVNGIHSLACGGCGRSIRLECSSSGGGGIGRTGSSKAASAPETGAHAAEAAETAERLAAAEAAVQRLGAENARLSSQYAEVAAELCDADAGRQRLELLGTLVTACKSALARAEQPAASAAGVTSSGSEDVVEDIRQALEMVEAAAQVGRADNAGGGAAGGDLDADLFADLYLDDLVPPSLSAAGEAVIGSSASDPTGVVAAVQTAEQRDDEVLCAGGAASGPASATGLPPPEPSLEAAALDDDAAISARSAFVAEFSSVSSRIRDAEAALAAERLAREQLARQLRIKATELQRVQSEHAAAVEELESALSPAATPSGSQLQHAGTPAASAAAPAPAVDVAALQATLAEREGRIRALSAQVADIQRRLGDNTRQARMQTLEREAAALRETRAELQRRVREDAVRSALEKRALSGRLAQEERRSRKQAAELGRLQAAFSSQEAMGRRKQEQLAAAQRRIRDLAEKSSRSNTSSAASQVAETIIAQLAARDSAVATARQSAAAAQAAAQSGGAASALPQPPGVHFMGVAAASAASKALGGGAVHFGPRLAELVRRGKREGALPARARGNADAAETGVDPARDGSEDDEPTGGARRSLGAAQSSPHEDGLVNLGACFDNRDRDRVPTWIRPLLEADIAARVALARAKKMHRRLTAERSALLALPASGADAARQRQQRADLLSLQIITVADVVLTLDAQVNAVREGGAGAAALARLGAARASRAKAEHWSFKLSDLRDAKAALRWSVSTAVALAESCDAATMLLAAEREARKPAAASTAVAAPAAAAVSMLLEPSSSSVDREAALAGIVAALEARVMELQAAVSAHAVLGCKIASPEQQDVEADDAPISGGAGGIVKRPKPAAVTAEGATSGDEVAVGALDAADQEEEEDEEEDDAVATDEDSDFSADEGRGKKRRRGAAGKKPPPRARAAADADDDSSGGEYVEQRVAKPAVRGKKKEPASAPAPGATDSITAAGGGGACSCGKTSTCTRCPCKTAGRSCVAECQCNKAKCKNHATAAVSVGGEAATGDGPIAAAPSAPAEAAPAVPSSLPQPPTTTPRAESAPPPQSTAAAALVAGAAGSKRPRTALSELGVVVSASANVSPAAPAKAPLSNPSQPPPPPPPAVRGAAESAPRVGDAADGSQPPPSVLGRASLTSSSFGSRIGKPQAPALGARSTSGGSISSTAASSARPFAASSGVRPSLGGGQGGSRLAPSSVAPPPPPPAASSSLFRRPGVAPAVSSAARPGGGFSGGLSKSASFAGRSSIAGGGSFAARGVGLPAPASAARPGVVAAATTALR